MTAFRASLQHNDSYAFREYPPLTDYQRIHQEILPDMSGESRPGLRRCDGCGELLNKWDEPLTGLVVKNRKYDIGTTYDGVTIVSKRFNEAYEAANLSGLDFLQLPDDSEFFVIRPVREIAFEAERSQTRFINQCSLCERFESVVTPYDYLKANSQIGYREFVRTDLEFGSGDEKHPLLLCGEFAANALNAAKLNGLDLIEIEVP
jgi:hypothetical protein